MRVLAVAAFCATSACAPGLVPMVSPAAALGVAGVAPSKDTVIVATASEVPSLPSRPRVDAVVTTAEVEREAVAVFGDTRPVAQDALGDHLALASPVWDMDVESFDDHARVELWVRRFSGGARETFERQLQRGAPYDSMMRAKLRGGGIPEDMVHLALIESGFDPHAYSRAAAVGMWQFMSSTARDVGLRVDWWVDERRDPVRSTDAAVRFLNDLRRQFGSLYLAAAAYNGGPTRIARGLSRYADDFEGTTGDHLFFALAETDVMRAETKDYVPKLIAAAIVAKAPERYGLRVPGAPSFSYFPRKN